MKHEDRLPDNSEWWRCIKYPFFNILQFLLLFLISVELDTSLLKHVTFLVRQEYCVSSSFFVTNSMEICLLCFCKSEITLRFHSHSGSVRKLLQAKKLLQALSRVISTPSSADISLMAGRKVISEEGSWWVTDVYAVLKRERTLFCVYLNTPAIFGAH